jgi:hypothetical protein
VREREGGIEGGNSFYRSEGGMEGGNLFDWSSSAYLFIRRGETILGSR